MKTNINMAREAGFMLIAEPNIDGSDWYECFTEEIESFAALVRADEREACAIDGGLACRYFEDSERVKNVIRARENT